MPFYDLGGKAAVLIDGILIIGVPRSVTVTQESYCDPLYDVIAGNPIRTLRPAGPVIANVEFIVEEWREGVREEDMREYRQQSLPETLKLEHKK